MLRPAASLRERLNVFQAGAMGCHSITVTDDILKKLTLVGNDLSDFSLDTGVGMETEAFNAEQVTSYWLTEANESLQVAEHLTKYPDFKRSFRQKCTAEYTAYQMATI